MMRSIAFFVRIKFIFTTLIILSISFMMIFFIFRSFTGVKLHERGRLFHFDAVKELYLDSLQWKDFRLNETFVENSCRYELNVQVWAQGKSAKICLLPIHSDIHVSRLIKNDGNWEMDIQKPLFTSVFQLYPNASFIDIGSHVGCFSLSAATLGRNVFAFEPTKVTFNHLTQSVLLNRFQHLMRVYPVALMDKRYKCVMPLVNKTNGNLGGTSVYPREECGNDTSAVATLDDLLPVFERQGIKEALIKMDCEGSEPKVIAGGKRFLSTIKVPYISMEFMAVKSKLRDGTNLEESYALLDTMRTFGYTPIRIGSDSSQPLWRTKFLEWPNDIAWVKGKQL